jgi:hypothetical protein
MPTTIARDPLVAGPHRRRIARRRKLCALRLAPVAGRPRTAAPASAPMPRAGVPSC